MSLKNKFFSIITFIAGIIVLSTVAFAQDVKTPATAPTAPQKAEKPFHGRGEFGPRKPGRPGMPGREGFMGKQRGHGKMGGGPMGFGRGINLTDAQKEQFRSIREANKPDKAVMDELRTIHESRKAGTDLTAEQKARINAIRDQMRTKAQSVHDQIQNILTAEQKAQIETRKVEMKQRMETMRKRFEDRRKDHPAKPAATDKPKTN